MSPRLRGWWTRRQQRKARKRYEHERARAALRKATLSEGWQGYDTGRDVIMVDTEGGRPTDFS